MSRLSASRPRTRALSIILPTRCRAAMQCSQPSTTAMPAVHAALSHCHGHTAPTLPPRAEEGFSGSGAATAAAPVPQWKWEDSDDAARSYAALALVLCGGAFCVNAGVLKGQIDLFYFVALAVTTQWIGAHRGLTSSQRQQINLKEGLLAPLAASASLFVC